MSNANAYINIGLNETIVKFEIDNNQISFTNGELIIVLDIITPNPPDYSDTRSVLFKDIIPNLNIPIKSGIHFIYNDSSEIKYFKGSLLDFANLSFNINSQYRKENFNDVSGKLRNILEGLNEESYVNLLTIVNYSEKDRIEQPLFYEAKNKFKNFYSVILFIGSFNNKYLSFTRYCKGFASKFLCCLPFFYYEGEIADESKYNTDQIGELIDNLDIKAIPYLKKYLKAFDDPNVKRNLVKLHENWISEFNSNLDNILNDYKKNIKTYVNKYLNKFKEEYKDIIDKIKNDYDNLMEKFYGEEKKKKKNDEIDDINFINKSYKISSYYKYLKNREEVDKIDKINNDYENFKKKIEDKKKIEEEKNNKYKGDFYEDWFEGSIIERNVHKAKCFPNYRNILLLYFFPFDELFKRIVFHTIIPDISDLCKECIKSQTYDVDLYYNIIYPYFINDIFERLETKINELKNSPFLIVSYKYIIGEVCDGFSFFNRFPKVYFFFPNFDDFKRECISVIENEENYYFENLIVYIFYCLIQAKIYKQYLDKFDFKAYFCYYYGVESDIQKMHLINVLCFNDEEDRLYDYMRREKKEYNPTILKDFKDFLDIIKSNFGIKIWNQKIIRRERLVYKSQTIEEIKDKIKKNELIKLRTNEDENAAKRAIIQIGLKNFDAYLDNIEKIKIESESEAGGLEQNHEIFLYKYIDKINQLNNTNIQIDDILKVLYDDNIIGFKQISEMTEKIEHFEEKIKDSELENKYNECEKEINNLEEGLDKGDKNIIENLKQKIYQKDFFYLFHYVMDGGCLYDYPKIVCDNECEDYYLNKFEIPWRTSCNRWHKELEFKEGFLFNKTCFFLSHDNKILNKVEKYVKYYKGYTCYNPGLHYRQISKDGLKEHIELLLKDIKNNLPSGWKIISKNDYFRIEPFGDKLKEIQLPYGKSTIYIDGIFKKIEDVIQAKNINNQILKINNKGNVTQDNLKEVYEDCFKMIINRINRGK